MKRIEIMAKMDEMDVAGEIIEFLIDHKFYYKECLWQDRNRLDAVREWNGCKESDTE